MLVAEEFAAQTEAGEAAAEAAEAAAEVSAPTLGATKFQQQLTISR